MANEFSKEEVVAFEQTLEGFNDELSMTGRVSRYTRPDAAMERSDNTIWRPMPYISTTYDGTDATAHFKRKTQLTVPARLGYQKGDAFTLSASELRDALQEKNLGKASMQALASEINQSVVNIVSLYGSTVVARTAAATGFDDVALADAVFTEIGVNKAERVLGLSTRDYNGMASNLASRSTMTGKPTSAYEKGYVGEVSSFETFKMDYNYRLAAAGGGGSLTIDTRSSAGNYYTPRATSVGADGQKSNVDNRWQTITVSSTTSVAAGDVFTVAGVEAVHLITKATTGQLKTFRVVSVPSSTTLVITPPIISNQGGTDAEEQYQNVSVTASATAAIVFKNIAAAWANPFWTKDSIELMPAKYAIPQGSGVAVMTATTDQGIPVTMQRWQVGETMETRYRFDAWWGVTNLNTEKNGILLFSQA